MNKTEVTILAVVGTITAALLGGYFIGPARLMPISLTKAMMPVKIERTVFASEPLSSEELFTLKARYPHAVRFEKAGIKVYDGPKTCLKCHEKIQVEDVKTGNVRQVNLMDNLLASSHWRNYQDFLPATYDIKGNPITGIPMGMMNRL